MFEAPPVECSNRIPEPPLLPKLHFYTTGNLVLHIILLSMTGFPPPLWASALTGACRCMYLSHEVRR